MSNQSSTADVELVYPTLEMLDESEHFDSISLVREINKLKKQIYDIAQSKR